MTGPASSVGVICTAAWVLVSIRASGQENPKERFVHVRLESTEAVVLQRREGQNDWVDVCHLPCDKPLPASDRYRYRVHADGNVASTPFRLDSANATTTIKASIEESSGHTTGIVLIIGGIAVDAVGGTIAVVGIVKKIGGSGGQGALTGGFVTAAVGGAIALVGVVYLATSKDSRVLATHNGIDDQATRFPRGSDLVRTFRPVATEVPIVGFRF